MTLKDETQLESVIKLADIAAQNLEKAIEQITLIEDPNTKKVAINHLSKHFESLMAKYPSI